MERPLGLNGAVSWGSTPTTSNPSSYSLPTTVRKDRTPRHKVYWKNLPRGEHAADGRQRRPVVPQRQQLVRIGRSEFLRQQLPVDEPAVPHRRGDCAPERPTPDGPDIDQDPARSQEKFDSAFTLNASIGKNWYIHRQYMLGFSLEVKNILNNQDIKHRRLRADASEPRPTSRTPVW